MLEKIDGIIIKTQDYGETHKLVTIFSNKIGKFNALAKGAKKPKSRMAAVTQPFINARFFVYIGTGLSTIQQGEVLDSFRIVREDIFKTAYVSYIAELTDKLLDSKDNDPYLFEQFYQTLLWINNHDEVDIPIIMYELKLYKKAGFAPILHQCSRCGKRENLIRFSISEGGMLCQQCAYFDPEAITISGKLSRLLYLFSEVDLKRIGNIRMKKANVQLIRKILYEYYDQYGGFGIKSRKVLDQLDLLNVTDGNSPTE
ncbi:DNA repair protein RecO [Oceanobacillus kimchii]|uniref:DNA repair protein RecO n=1 Tax=Oceanobacillus kimchii TaxID=746691 RepID=UPI00034BA047|nr:DNA repair protein RecO [Oceanobacillus kimchii]